MKKIASQVIADFLTDSLSTLHFITFSDPLQKTLSDKVRIAPILVKSQMQMQFVTYAPTSSFTENCTLDKAKEKIQLLCQQYSKVFIRTSDAEYSGTITDEKIQLSSRKVAAKEPARTHNKSKQYLFPDGVYEPFLVELGLMTKEGRVISREYNKFRQINRFCELVEDILPQFSTSQKIHIVDFGCGKAYLTFALYKLLQKTFKGQIVVTGVDRRLDLIKANNEAAKKIGCINLQFVEGDIESYTTDIPIDVVVALHACDTATDDAIAKAFFWQAKAIFAAPCCQHELACQLTKEKWPLLLKHGLFRERFASLATDALRVHVLECQGYSVDVIEFVDPMHTPKNLLIRAIKTKDAQNLSQEYREFITQFAIHPKLEKLLT